MVAKPKLLRRVQTLVVLVVEQPFVLDLVADSTALLQADSTALLQAGKRNTRHHIRPYSAYFFKMNDITFDGFLGKNV